MTLRRTTLSQKVIGYEDLIRAFVFVLAVIAALLVMTAIFGINVTGPSYEIVPDPAGVLPF